MSYREFSPITPCFNATGAGGRKLSLPRTVVTQESATGRETARRLKKGQRPSVRYCVNRAKSSGNQQIVATKAWPTGSRRVNQLCFLIVPVEFFASDVTVTST